jgi:hypothetical protein
MDALHNSIEKARKVRFEALRMPPYEFGSWAKKLHDEALALSKDICGDYHEYNKWMRIADLHQITCIDGMLLAVESMRLKLQ